MKEAPPAGEAKAAETTPAEVTKAMEETPEAEAPKGIEASATEAAPRPAAAEAVEAEMKTLAAMPVVEAPAPATGGGNGAAATGERAMSPIPVGSQITTETGQISTDYLQIKVPY